MSMREYNVGGVGFYTENITEEQMENFLRKHEAVIENFENSRISCYAMDLIPNLDNAKSEEIEEFDLLDEVRMITDGTYAELICETINAELGGTIRLCYAGVDEDSREAVYFAPDYPWFMTDKEKTMTREALEDLLKPYANEFGTGVTSVDLTFYG